MFNLAGGTSIAWLSLTVPFNLDGNGAHPTAWVAPSHPFLALDGNGNGIVDDGTELFSTAMVIGATGQTAANGFAALAQYDANHDGQIDDQDPIFSRLLLWFEANSDGVCQPDEVSLLEFSGIDTINLNAQAQPAPASANTPFISFASTFSEHVCSPAISMFVGDAWFPTTR